MNDRPHGTPPDLRVPAGFELGVATSSYQVEGAAHADGRGPSIWDTFSRRPGAVIDGSDGTVACDHYGRLEQDLDLIAWLGVDVYRFSVAWPRIVPAGAGAVNPAGLDFYDRLVDGLLDRGVAPAVTLYHWDLPDALERAGGWSRRDTAEHFAAYAEVVGRRLGDRVAHWATVNEPWCSAFLGYHAGVHAPGARDSARAVAAAHHLMLAHGLGVASLRTTVTGGVGIVLNLNDVQPASPSAGDVAAARLVDAARNRWWLDPVAGRGYPDDLLEVFDRIVDLDGLVRDGDTATAAAPIDLLGINYYSPEHVAAAGPGDPPVGPGLDHLAVVQVPGERTAMDWLVDADGLERLLRRVAHDLPGTPVVVTENGAAYDDRVAADGAVHDHARIDYLAGHLRAVQRAVDAGVDVRGYYAWSLMDNFEWAEGYTRRFGLFHVDFDTLVRTPKDSAHWFRELSRARHDVPEPA
jgi:beta-glucosidase